MTETTELSQYVQGFSANLNLSPQQTDTKLLNCVDSDLAYAPPGEMFNADDVDFTDPEDVQTRVGDTPDKFLGATRRVGMFGEFHDSAWFDKVDEVKEITDPTSTKMRALTAGRWRKVDNKIIAVGLGNAVSKTDNTDTFTTTALPAAQIILPNDVTYAHEDEVVPTDASNYGMGVGKIIQAGLLLDESELEGERYLLLSSKQKGDLLRTTPVTNKFYNDVQALQSGKVMSLLGFTIITMASKRLLLQSAGIRRCMAWIKPAICYRGRTISNTSISVRADKQNTPQAYYKASHAGVRRYDGGVVEIRCKEV